MRFDEADRDLQVGLQPAAIQKNRDSVLCFTCVFQGGVVEGVVVQDSVAVHDFVAEHLAQLCVRVGAVCAGGNQDDNVLVGEVGEVAKENRQNCRAGHGAGNVAYRYGDCVARLRELSERLCSSYGIADGSLYSSYRVGKAG